MSARRYPVSIKGVLAIDGRIPLLFNERQEWELPGGRLEPGEQPEQALVREIAEELGLEVACGAILDSWRYDIAGQGAVFIVTYGCRLLRPGTPIVSSEHKELRLFAPAEIDRLRMPPGYLASIRRFLSLG
jgi:8-oxo-dGTP pyrophosphatase MutT (NUDIX family)